MNDPVIPAGHVLLLARYTDTNPRLAVVATEGANIVDSLKGADITPTGFEMKALSDYNGVENDFWIIQIRPADEPVMAL